MSELEATSSSFAPLQSIAYSRGKLFPDLPANVAVDFWGRATTPPVLKAKVDESAPDRLFSRESTTEPTVGKKVRFAEEVENIEPTAEQIQRIDLIGRPLPTIAAETAPNIEDETINKGGGGGGSGGVKGGKSSKGKGGGDEGEEGEGDEAEANRRQALKEFLAAVAVAAALIAWVL